MAVAPQLRSSLHKPFPKVSHYNERVVRVAPFAAIGTEHREGLDLTHCRHSLTLGKAEEQTFIYGPLADRASQIRLISFD